jgi:hypothetical protein
MREVVSLKRFAAMPRISSTDLQFSTTISLKILGKTSKL